jgi:hypothetical protein
MSDSGCHSGRSTSGRASRSERGIAGVAGGSVQQIAREPAQREGRRVAATQEHRSRAHQIFHGRAIHLRNPVLLQACPVGGRESRHIGVDLHRYRNACQRPRILVASQPLIQPVRLFQHELGHMGDDRVDLRVDRIESSQRSLCGLAGRNLACANQVSKIGGRQTPEFSAGASGSTAVNAVLHRSTCGGCGHLRYS